EAALPQHGVRGARDLPARGRALRRELGDLAPAARVVLLERVDLGEEVAARVELADARRRLLEVAAVEAVEVEQPPAQPLVRAADRRLGVDEDVGGRVDPDAVL